jgi:hypothetical protein
MPRKNPTPHERLLERAAISAGDMHQAIAFLDAALALDKRTSNDPASDPTIRTTREALEVAAVIYYARPFTHNESRKKKRRQPPGAPALPNIDLGPLHKVLTSKEARKLHREALQIRHKIVAHAEARYNPVRLLELPSQGNAGRKIEYAMATTRSAPKFNLERLRWNAVQLAAVFGIHAHAAALGVKATRKVSKGKSAISSSSGPHTSTG